MNSILLHAEDCVLMTIDIQQKLYSAMEEGFRETFLKNSILLLETAHVFEMPVLVSEQYPKGLGRTIDEIDAHIAGIPRYEKMHFSLYRDSVINAKVDSLAKKTVIVIGIEAHVCVFQTVMDLLMAGYRVVVADDAVCSRRSHDRHTALAQMAGAGAVIYSAEMIAFMLLEKAGTVQFKKLAPLFR